MYTGYWTKQLSVTWRNIKEHAIESCVIVNNVTTATLESKTKKAWKRHLETVWTAFTCIWAFRILSKTAARSWIITPSWPLVSLFLRFLFNLNLVYGCFPLDFVWKWYEIKLRIDLLTVDFFHSYLKETKKINNQFLNSKRLSSLYFALATNQNTTNLMQFGILYWSGQWTWGNDNGIMYALYGKAWICILIQSMAMRWLCKNRTLTLKYSEYPPPTKNVPQLSSSVLVKKAVDYVPCRIFLKGRWQSNSLRSSDLIFTNIGINCSLREPPRN